MICAPPSLMAVLINAGTVSFLIPAVFWQSVPEESRLEGLSVREDFCVGGDAVVSMQPKSDAMAVPWV